MEKNTKSCVITDVAIPGDCRMNEKEFEKIEKYQNLKRQMKRLWLLKKIEVATVIAGNLGCFSKGFNFHLK